MSGGVDAHRRGPLGGGRAHPARGRGVRASRDPRRAHRPRRPLRGARPLGRPHPRAARRAADGPELLLRRYPHRPHPGRLAARLEIGRPARRAPPPGERGVAAAHGAVRVGHVEHAHRGRRRRPGVRADGGPAEVGAELRAGHRVRDPAPRPPRPPPRRRHATGVGILPRCVPVPDRAARRRGTRGRAPRRARARQPAGRRVRRRRRAPRRRRSPAAGRRTAGRLPDLRFQARRLRGRPASAHRRARLARRGRPRPRVDRMGRVRLRRRGRGRGRARAVREAPERRAGGGAQPGQPRARPPRLRRLLPVRRRHGRGRCTTSPEPGRRSGTTTTPAPRARGCAGWKRRSPAWCARGRSTRSGSGG